MLFQNSFATIQNPIYDYDGIKEIQDDLVFFLKQYHTKNGLTVERKF